MALIAQNANLLEKYVHKWPCVGRSELLLIIGTRMAICGELKLLRKDRGSTSCVQEAKVTLKYQPIVTDAKEATLYAGPENVQSHWKKVVDSEMSLV